MNQEPPESGSYDHRFSGIRRLYGNTKIPTLQQAHFTIVGVGGVGSWAAESLARSGIGTLTSSTGTTFASLIPTAEIHAHNGSAGKLKVGQLAERIKLINPSCIVHAQRAFYTPENANELILPNMNYVIDAIDRKNTKIHLINHCRRNNIPIITCGRAGGRTDQVKSERLI